MTGQARAVDHQSPALELSEIIEGSALSSGSGFSARGFRERQFDGLMDPLIMVDHFVMIEPTFGPHPHAGMSAVSLLFEDSEGRFHNRDSLGNNLDLLPGDLYWLKAARGVVHDEKPRPGARTHGLQFFVNLPARHKNDEPAALHVPAARMPVLEGEGYRLRVVLGEFDGVVGARPPALPLNLVEGGLSAGAATDHSLQSGQSLWVYAITGTLTLTVGGLKRTLSEGESLALRNTSPQALPLAIQADLDTHVVLIEAEPLRECFVQKGPFVMSALEDLTRANRDYANGLMGELQ